MVLGHKYPLAPVDIGYQPSCHLRNKGVTALHFNLWVGRYQLLKLFELEYILANFNKKRCFGFCFENRSEPNIFATVWAYFSLNSRIMAFELGTSLGSNL